MEETCFFDLETKNLFEDIDSNYPIYSWSQKESLRPELTQKLGMACACILDEQGKKHEFEEGEEQNLIETLNGFDKIVGHNIINFDYLVLKPFDDNGLLNNFLKKTIDSFNILKEKTGQYVSLNDLAKLNLGSKKTEDSKLIPKMWAQGEKQRVKDYCFNDVKIIKKIYKLGSNAHIKYYVKDFGTIVRIGKLEKLW